MHLAHLLVLVLLRACGRMKRSGLGVVPCGLRNRMGAGSRELGVSGTGTEHRPALAPPIGRSDASKSGTEKALLIYSLKKYLI
jgi:hypothetical protein